VYLSYLLMGLMASTSPAVNDPFSVQQVSARTLTGEELVRIAEIHDRQNHFPEALTYYEQALEAFRARKQRRGEAIVGTRIGSMYERQGRRQEAAVHVRHALTLFSKAPESPVYADALFLMARLSLWLGNADEAGPLFERAKERYRRAHNVQALESVMLQSGLLKVREASSDEGLHEIRQVLDEARTRKDREQTLAALVVSGDADWILERNQSAAAHYDESLILLQEQPQAKTEAGVRMRVAAVRGDMGAGEQGLDSAKRAVILYQSLRDVSGEAAAWALFGSLHEALGHGFEAEEAHRRALQIYRQRSVIVHDFAPPSPAAATARTESR
jgi:tetratricopeptide (TPR) repeat protein